MFVSGLTIGVALLVGQTLTWNLTSFDDRLVGTWDGRVTVDSGQLAENPVLPDRARGKARGIALVFGAMASAKRMTLEFREDGTATNRLTSLGQVREQTGSWLVAERRDDRLTVEMTLDDVGRQVRFPFRIIDGNQLELVIAAPSGLSKGFRHRFQRRQD